MQTLKDPKSHLRSHSHDSVSKIEFEKLNLDGMLPGPAAEENKGTPGRKTFQLDSKSKLARSDSHKDGSNMSRKSTRVSLMG